MESKNWSLERIWSGIGWGLALILTGILILADNQGWIQGDEGWWYFAIGLGALFIIGFLVSFFSNRVNSRKSIGGLMIGLALVYTGGAFLNGLGDWWPLALVPIGIGFVISAFWRPKPESYAQVKHSQESPGHISGN